MPSISVPTALAAASVASAGIGAYSANKAASTQAKAATAAANQQAELGHEALDFQKGIDTRTYGDLAPYRAAGVAALPAYQNLLGIGPNGMAGAQTALEATPGYQFTRDQGIASEARALGSKGLTGAQSKGIARFVTGLADNTYNTQLGNYNTAANLGLGAVGEGAGIGAQTGSNVGNTTANIGQAITNGITGAANASAGGTAGIAGSIANGVNGASNAYLYSKLLGQTGANSGLYSSFSPGAGVTQI